MAQRSAIVYLRPEGHADETTPVVDGLDVVDTIRDEAGPSREGLGPALERLAAGELSALVLARLDAAAGSLPELVALLDWLDAAGVDLVAVDVGLDTDTPSGRRTVAVLREVERWEREPGPGRPPRGRPGLVSQAPELAARIGALRAGGLSLQAIADELNAAGVPTRRGGAQWRPSSVQAALGYRRPRPPAPGAPPPPQASEPGRGPKPRKPRGRPRHGPGGPGRGTPGPGAPGRGKRP